MKFEDRKGSIGPRVQRLLYKDVFVFLITGFGGCWCETRGCDGYLPTNKKVRIRKQSDGSVVYTKTGRNNVKLNPKKDYTEQDVMKIVKENYDL